jgi:TolA-binding protein
MRPVTQLSCIDDRVVLARRGALSSSEWSDFATHLATCADCRIAWRLAADFDGSGGAQPGDERIVARAAKVALASTGRARVGVVRVAFAAGVTLVVAGMASGAVLLHARYAASTRADHAVAPAVPHTRRAAGKLAARRPQQDEPTSTPTPPPPSSLAPTPAPTSTEFMVAPASAEPAPVPAMQHPVRRVAQASAVSLQPPAFPSPQPPATESAATLLARAVSARSRGRLPEAIEDFRGLQSRFPATPEALVSLVSLAELWLEAGAPSAALGLFEDYVRRAPSGALLPEALAGQARALTALGREQEGQAAWRALARRFPGSPYARAAPATATAASGTRVMRDEEDP